MSDLAEYFPIILSGLKITLLTTLGATGVSSLFALTAGLGRRSGSALLRVLSSCYVEFFRGTSALVQLFWVYFALPLLGIQLDAMTTGILVLGLNSGAYGAEIVRGAIQSVPREQYQAAYALNFSERQVQWRIVIPQALIAMIPPASNLAIELLKNTALVSLITLSDITFQAQTIRATTMESGKVFGIILLIYFLIAQGISFSFRQVERKLALGRDHGGVR